MEFVPYNWSGCVVRMVVFAEVVLTVFVGGGREVRDGHDSGKTPVDDPLRDWLDRSPVVKQTLTCSVAMHALIQRPKFRQLKI